MFKFLIFVGISDFLGVLRFFVLRNMSVIRPLVFVVFMHRVTVFLCDVPGLDCVFFFRVHPKCSKTPGFPREAVSLSMEDSFKIHSL